MVRPGFPMPLVPASPRQPASGGNARSSVDLSPRDIGTILAGLRLWQSRLNWFDGGHQEPPRLLDLMEIATDGTSFQRLSCAEIDALCERLSLGDIPCPAAVLPGMEG